MHCLVIVKDMASCHLAWANPNLCTMPIFSSFENQSQIRIHFESWLNQTLKLAQFFHKYCWNQSHVLLDSMSCAMRVAFFCERWCVDKSKSCFAGCMLLKYVHSIATMSSENTVCKTNFKRTSLLYSACLH